MNQRSWCLIAALGCSLCVAGQSNSAQKSAEIDPNALAALDKMSSYLRTVTTFEVEAETTTDDVLENSQTVQSNHNVRMLAARPNRLFVEITSDEMHRFFFYDGKSFTVYGKLVDYYATVPAPPTIHELIDKLQQKYNIEVPLVDLFLWGSDESLGARQITSAIDVGPSSIEGITCEQYAFRQNGLDWQIWIQQGDYPLPKKLILITTDDEARPRFSQILRWNLAPSFNDAVFTFDPPVTARRISIAQIPETTDSNKNADHGGAK